MRADMLEQLIPLGSLLAAVTIGLTLIDRTDPTSKTHTMNFHMMVICSVTFICSIWASGLMLSDIGRYETMLNEFVDYRDLPRETRNDYLARLLTPEIKDKLEARFNVGFYGAGLGIVLMINAIGRSGFARSKRDGWLTLIYALAGLLVVGFVF